MLIDMQVMQKVMHARPAHEDVKFLTSMTQKSNTILKNVLCAQWSNDFNDFQSLVQAVKVS